MPSLRNTYSGVCFDASQQQNGFLDLNLLLLYVSNFEADRIMFYNDQLASIHENSKAILTCMNNFINISVNEYGEEYSVVHIGCTGFDKLEIQFAWS